MAGSFESPGIVVSAQEEKKCSFITPSSDPLYVSYPDEELGIPIHDDRMLFELLVLTRAQAGMDWTTISKKRNEFRLEPIQETVLIQGKKLVLRQFKILNEMNKFVWQHSIC